MLLLIIAFMFRLMKRNMAIMEAPESIAWNAYLIDIRWACTLLANKLRLQRQNMRNAVPGKFLFDRSAQTSHLFKPCFHIDGYLLWPISSFFKLSEWNYSPVALHSNKTHWTWMKSKIFDIPFLSDELNPVHTLHFVQTLIFIGEFLFFLFNHVNLIFIWLKWSTWWD